MIPIYPESTEITMDLRPLLHPQFQTLAEGISEFVFVNIYLFRDIYNYRISKLDENLFVILGKDNDNQNHLRPPNVSK